MGSLSELALQTSYHKGRDSIAHDFYLPSMFRASEYDRAVAFFRSTVFIIAWPALKEFILKGGHIRVLCSQVLADEDVDALEKGFSARADAELSSRLKQEVHGLLSDDVLREPTRVLAALVAQGCIQFQIAVMKHSDLNTAKERIFHDKLGIFRDRQGNVVVFKGSMNETWSGLAGDGNLESVDVAASWMGQRDLERTTTEQAYFQDLWENNYPTVLVRPFPEVAKSELENSAVENWEGSLDSLLSGDRDVNSPPKRSLMSHQAAGLASWAANNRAGILEFATGSGKTFTAITAIRECLSRFQEPVLVVVPDQVLFQQWYKELTDPTNELSASILRAGAGHDLWRTNLPLWTRPGSERRVVLATLQTASRSDFRQLLVGGEHLVLIADEVHRLGSPKHRQLMEETCFGARLGLSATPERAGDPEGTSAILTFFRRILEPRYTLWDAIRDEVLCRYFYRPHPVRLDEDEADEWKSISRQIFQLTFQGERGRNPDAADRLKHLLIKRARVVKQARSKIALAAEVVQHYFERGQKWIVYCDDLSQLTSVCSALDQAGIETFPFHSQMTGDREETLKWFTRRGGVVVAIKCLDEGVDIPSVTHALILASSKNPREFIQRRGRVLRRAPNKALAYVHDAIVLPPEDATQTVPSAPDPITAGELARAIEFAQYADNPAAAADLKEIAVQVGVDWRSLAPEGLEDDDE
jgi:superfamily II DNA or RNA helicase